MPETIADNGFNSLMVRLKANPFSFEEYRYVGFQFPNGSIKRFVALATVTRLTKFQFPNGSIKRLRPLPFGVSWYQVSIP